MAGFFLGAATLFLATACLGPIASLTEAKLQDAPMLILVLVFLGLWVVSTLISAACSDIETIPMVGIRTVYYTGIGALGLVIQPLGDALRNGFSAKHFLAIAGFLVVGGLFAGVGYKLKPPDY